MNDKPADLLLCGVDEVGRGAAVGDIFAAACILPLDHGMKLKDSKKLSPRQREALAREIRKEAVAWGIGRVDCGEIKLLNVHRASLVAMERAVLGLSTHPNRVIVDGRFPLSLPFPCRSLVGADDTVPAVSAASILAKVARDAYMDGLHKRYPEYGFNRNRGYLTSFHKETLMSLGPCPEHRLHYRPVQQALQRFTSFEEKTLFKDE